jgi:hypothetical protein
MGDEVDEDEAALLRRAEEAVAAAERIRAGSEVVVGVSAALRQSGMTARCAWCGRYRAGEHWVLFEQLPSFAEYAEVTHGICEACTDALRASGMSV